MGYTTTLMVLFLVISLALSLSNPDEWGSPLSDMLVTLNPDTKEINFSGLTSEIITIFVISSGLGIFAGIWKGDITYGLFSGFVIFMIGFAIIPVNFFVNKDIPFFIKSIIGIPLGVMFALGLIGWFRGSEL